MTNTINILIGIGLIPLTLTLGFPISKAMRFFNIFKSDTDKNILKGVKLKW